MRRAAFGVAALVLVATARATEPVTEPVDWNALADVETVRIETRREDGASRETTVWLVVWRGQGYVRSSGTRWLDEALRDPDVMLRVAGDAYPLRATPIKDSPTWEAVTAAFRSKYGWSDAALGLLRNLRGVPTILRLDPRTSLAPVRLPEAAPDPPDPAP